MNINLEICSVICTLCFYQIYPW